jgi:hypothetical protein
VTRAANDEAMTDVATGLYDKRNERFKEIEVQASAQTCGPAAADRTGPEHH